MASLFEAKKLFEEGNLASAAALAKQIAARPSAPPEAVMLWGVAAAEAGAFGEAISPLERARRHAKDNPARQALLDVQLGRALISVGRWREGLETLARVERQPPRDPHLRARLGVALAGAGQLQRAITHLRFAASQRPQDAGGLVDLAWTLAALDDLGEAELCYESAILSAPRFARAHAGLAALRPWREADNHIPRLNRVLADAAIPDDRVEVGYALFKELHDVGRLEEAWEALITANDTVYGTEPWLPAADAALVDALIRRFPVKLFEGLRHDAGRLNDGVPIFILGLPRTGTTLVERVIAAHSKVVALSELPFFPMAFRSAAGSMSDAPITARLVKATKGARWPLAGASYLREATSLSRGAAFIDKLPFNSLLAGAIRLALPHSRIVLVERDPMDALWSAYRSPFPAGTWYGWSRRQEDLVAHYVDHQRLMDHWRAALGDGLIQIRYEDLVTKPEATIRSLLERCGLDFESACIRPHETPGAVLTLSQRAVRSPINTNAIGGWIAHAEKLEPLRRELTRAGLLEKPR